MTERVKKRKGLKIFLIVLLTLVLIGALMLVLYYELPYRPVGNDRDKLTAIPFSSAEDVDRVYSDFASFGYYRTIDPHEIFYLFQGATKEDASISSDEASSDGAAPDYSGTNTQVEGIDEADIVKTDGKYIYAVNSYKLNILSASNGVTEKLSSISLEGSSNEFYIYGDTLAIVYNSNDIGTSNATGYGIKVYSIADRSAPRLIRTVEHGGEHQTEGHTQDGIHNAQDHRALDAVNARAQHQGAKAVHGSFVPVVGAKAQAEPAQGAEQRVQPGRCDRVENKKRQRTGQCAHDALEKAGRGVAGIGIFRKQ